MLRGPGALSSIQKPRVSLGELVGSDGLQVKVFWAPKSAAQSVRVPALLKEGNWPSLVFLRLTLVWPSDVALTCHPK